MFAKALKKVVGIFKKKSKKQYDLAEFVDKYDYWVPVPSRTLTPKEVSRQKRLFYRKKRSQEKRMR